MTIFNNPSFLTILLMFIFGLVLAVFFIYFIFRLSLSQKDKGGHIYFKVSEEFEHQLEEMMKEELRQLTAKLDRKAGLFIEEMAELYKKKVDSFFNGANGEFAKMSEINKKIQRGLLNETEKKMVEFDAGYAQVRGMLFQEAKDKTAELGNSLSENVLRISRETEKSLREKTAEINKELVGYREKKMRAVDEQIYRIIGQVAKSTIGKSVDISGHEELVMEALEKAKKEFFKFL